MAPHAQQLTGMDHATLVTLRDRHPAWRLLASPHAPLVASFLHRVFVVPNVRVMSEADLAEALEDELFALRERLGADGYPKGAPEYLNDWAAPDKGWLRKFYKPGTDEAQFDLTPATEKAIAWLVSLTERPFVGTESRLLTLFALLEQISAGTEADPVKRVDDLRRKRDEIDAEIARVLAGDVPLLDDTAVKDRFQQFQQLARELLADFREVEHNFRLLDRKVREKIALWEGAKGALLDEIMGERDAIGDSDQGRSFRAFWDFLMSSRRQEELSERLDQVLALPAVAALKPEPRTRRVHHDWLEAGEHTQRTVAQLSQQLRRFLDDRAFLENRRILDLLHGIESKALALREATPSGTVMHIDAMGADIELPLERPLVHAEREAAPGRTGARRLARTTSTPRACSTRSWWTRRACARLSSAHCAASRRSRCASCWRPSLCTRAWRNWWPTWSWPTPGTAATPWTACAPSSTKPWRNRSAGRPATQRGEAVTREARLPRVIFTR